MKNYCLMNWTKEKKKHMQFLFVHICVSTNPLFCGYVWIQYQIGGFLPSAWAWNWSTAFLATISGAITWPFFFFGFHRSWWLWSNTICPEIKNIFFLVFDSHRCSSKHVENLTLKVDTHIVVVFSFEKSFRFESDKFVFAMADFFMRASFYTNSELSTG